MGVVYQNFKLLSGINAEERCFAWKLSQDILALGNRIFRRNAEKRCLTTLADGSLCQEVQDIDHAFKNCEVVMDTYYMMIMALNRITEINISSKLLFHLVCGEGYVYHF